MACKDSLFYVVSSLGMSAIAVHVRICVYILDKAQTKSRHTEEHLRVNG